MRKFLLFFISLMPIHAFGATFVQDTFTDPNGTELSAHSGEIGASWVNHSSFTLETYAIDLNRAITPTANIAMAYASGVPAGADYDVSATFRVMTAAYNATGQGIAARVDPTSGVNTMIFFRYVATNGWQCFQTSNGTSTQIGSNSSQTLNVGQDYVVKLSVRGSTVTGYVDDVEKCTGTTTVLSAGRIGVRGTSASSTAGIAIADITATDAEVGGGAAGGSVLPSRRAKSDIDKRYEDTEAPYWEFFE
jgi:hypothetical protein